ncbi:IucA/IucC family protein, partial [Priestia megaterium]|uniref:IucA/IucC family protein n=1 Tax=Priestia megaterium TaxID=1404 RepID=UPI0039A26E0B
MLPLPQRKHQYFPHQSIPTFLNPTNRHNYHLNLPITILNTLVYRPLPTHPTVIPPQLTHHIKPIQHHDAFLKHTCKLPLLPQLPTL